MAIGRVPGAALLSDLDRQGLDLSFTTDNNALLKLDFSNYRIGVNTSTPQSELDVSGNILISQNLLSTGNVVSNIGTITNQFNTLHARNAVISNVYASAYYLSDGTPFISGGGGTAYGNANVAVYIPTDPTIIGIQNSITNANIGLLGYIDSVIGGGPSYGNTNVSSYLPTHAGNVSANHFIGDGSLLTGIVSNTMTLTAGEALNGHKVVTTNGVGKAIYANVSMLSHINSIIGITTISAILNDPVIVAYQGVVVEPSWSWTLNMPIYLTGLGTLTQTVATGGYILQVATPLTSTSIMITPKLPIALL